MNIKHCPQCDSTKPVEYFTRNSCKRDGYDVWCGTCKRAKAKESTAKKKQPWTEVEQNLMRSMYPAGGAYSCVMVMPNRTRGAIDQQASRMGIAIQMQPYKPWPMPTMSADELLGCQQLNAWRYTVEPAVLVARIAA